MEYSSEKHRQPSNLLLRMFRCWGLWSYFDESTEFKRILYSFYSQFGPCSVGIYFVTLLADCVSNCDDLDIVIEDTCLLFGTSLTIMKPITFRQNRKKIIELIDEVYTPIDNIAKCSDNAAIKLINAVVFEDKLQVYSFNMLGLFLATAMLIVSPKEAGSLPIRAKFPFDITIEPWHSLAFGIQCYAIFTTILSILCGDGLTMSFCRFLILQLHVLSSNYRHCQIKWPLASLDSSNEASKDYQSEIHSFIPFNAKEAKIIDNSFIGRFKICMRHHQRLLEITDHLNAIFGFNLFFQLFVSMSMLCFSGFQVIVSTKGGAYIIRFTIYGVITITHLLMWCFIGNELLYQGLAVSGSPWMSGWEAEDFKKYYYFITLALVRGKRTFEIKAVNFFSISLQTFLSIVRASYSFFTLLSGVMNE